MQLLSYVGYPCHFLTLIHPLSLVLCANEIFIQIMALVQPHRRFEPHFPECRAQTAVMEFAAHASVRKLKC